MTTGKQSRPLGAHMSIAGGLSHAVEHALAVKATAVQIFTRNQKRWENPPLAPGEAAAFREAARKLRYVCAHAGYLINLASPDPAARERSRLALLDELGRANQAGCDCIVLHPGSPKEDDSATGIARVAGEIRTILDATPDYQTAIAFENTAGQGASLGSSLRELGDLLAACDRHPRLGVCIDTAHAFAAGYDLRTEAGIATLCRELDTVAGWHRVRVLHLNDAMNPCGSHRDRHEHIGQGEIGEAGFRRFLAIPELRHVPGIIETPKDPKTLAEDKLNLRILRRLDRAT